MDELFPQPLVLRQLPALGKLLVPEIPVIMMMKGRFPGDVVLWGCPVP